MGELHHQLKSVSRAQPSFIRPVLLGLGPCSEICIRNPLLVAKESARELVDLISEMDGEDSGNMYQP